ncbi:hypothetical protein KAR10_02410, partial [bacterium]|nr:hypothetical protein [bacterium]
DTGKNLADAKLRAGRFDAGIKGSRKQLRSLKPEGAIPYAESIIYEKAAEVIEHGAKPVVAGFEQMGKSNASYLKGVEIVKEKKHKISCNFRTHDKILTNGFSGLQTILRQSKRAVAYGPIGGIVLMLSASISAAATTQQGEMQKPSHHNRLLGNGLNALRTIPLVSVWPTATKTMAPTVKKLGKTALELGGQGLRAAQEGGAKAKSATNQYISQTRNNAFNTAYKIHLTTKAAYQKTKAGLIEAGEWLNQSAVTSIKQTKTNTLDKAYQIDHAARAAYQKGKEIAGGTGVGR